jgi:hypothetical protein
MKTKYKYIWFMLLNDTGKTTRWSIHNNRSNAYLGEIKWYGGWRQYCFFTTMDAIFNDGCLLDILDFIKQLKDAPAKSAEPAPEPLTTSSILTHGRLPLRGLAK